MARICPKCGLKNPDSAQQCDCGFSFGLGDGSMPSAIMARSGAAKRWAVDYDENVIVTFADRLYKDASRIIVAAAVVGLVLCAVGAWALFKSASPGSSLQLPFSVIAGLAGGLVGWLIGSSLAFWLRLAAQTALCQVQIERNTRIAHKAPP